MKIKLLFTPRFELDIHVGGPTRIPMLPPLGMAASP